MAERSGSERRKMERAITIRMPAALDAAIVSAAGDMTRGDWIREVLSKELAVKAVNSGRRSPGARRTLQASQADLQQLRALAVTTARAIGILKLTAQAMRVTSTRDLHAQAEATLSEMQRAAREIQAKLRELGVA